MGKVVWFTQINDTQQFYIIFEEKLVIEVCLKQTKVIESRILKCKNQKSFQLFLILQQPL
jgi:hypothetical protein